MITPFHRSWLRSPWFVAALVCVAVAEWHTAILRIREMRREAAFTRQAVDGIAELIRVTDAIAATHK